MDKQINNILQNDEADTREVKNGNIFGIYNRDDNSFVSIEVNEGKGIDELQKKTSIFEACKKLYEFEKLNNIADNERLTKVFSLDKSIIVKVEGVTDEQVYDQLAKYENELLHNNELVDNLNREDNICEKLNKYEKAFNIPNENKMTRWFGEYGMVVPKLGVSDEQIKNRIAFFDKTSEIVAELIKNDELIEKFMICVCVKGIQELYIDDANYKGVTDGPVNYLSRQEQIQKLMETIINFKDPVIARSKEELNKLQDEYRKEHGLATESKELLDTEKEKITLEQFVKEHHNSAIEILTPGGYVTIKPNTELSQISAHSGSSDIKMIIHWDELKEQVINSNNYNEKDGKWYLISEFPQPENTEKTKNIDVKKAELLKLMDEQNTRGYIRISHEDYAEIRNQIEEMGITYISKESGIKVGMNIVVPTNAMQELKDMLIKNNIEILQEVEGNVDWYDLKKIKGLGAYSASKDSLKNFQEMNSDKFKYIAFENEGKYSIYTEPGCTVEVEGEKIKHKEDGKNHEKKTLKEVTKKKDEYKKSKEEAENKNHEKNNERGDR